MFSDNNGKPLSVKDMHLTPSAVKQLEIKKPKKL